MVRAPSWQVIIQLRKFAQTVASRNQKASAERQAAPRMVGAGASASPSASSSPRLSLGSDLSDMLSTEMTGIDTSVLGALAAVLDPCRCDESHTLTQESFSTCLISMWPTAAARFCFTSPCLIACVLNAARGSVENDVRFRVAGVVKRVTGLLLAMTGLGVLLFYVGLKYAFPNGI
jgi:hypothetical protein